MKPELVKVSSGNRIRIPEEMAKEVNIRVGDYIVLRIDSSTIVIQKLDVAKALGL